MADSTEMNPTAETDIESYLDLHENKQMLRFITCGSVDDGKSTVIGRMLYDSKMIFEDQLKALENDSGKVGTQGSNIDFALLVDGLAAEREQGITIDVAYRFFATDKRKFIVADTPGHEQYTRNMATGASTADVAVILIDARKGVLTQTRRHSFIVGLLGIRQVVLAINKMDLVDYDQATYDQIVADYTAFAEELVDKGCVPFEIQAIPMSGLVGDNILNPSENMKWYKGPSLLHYLEEVPFENIAREQPFRMPVQWVNRPNLDFRGFSGRVASGELSVGDSIKVLPAAKVSKVAKLFDTDQEVETIVAGQSVTIVLEDEIDVSRGDMIAQVDRPPEVANQFETSIIWMANKPLLPGRSYLLKSAAGTAQATITNAKYKIDVNTLEHNPAAEVELNEIATCNISLDRRIPFDSYTDNRETGSFILIDRLSNETVGAGMMHFALRRAANIHWQATDVSNEARARMKNQKPSVLWFTGLSGSGKSTVANILDQKLVTLGHHTHILDGDNVRHGLNRDLGFTDADRVENIRRVSEVAKLMAEAGLIVLVSFISPFRSERRLAREIMPDIDFIEVHIDTPLEVAEQRDVKGLYAKARAGEIANFTGIDSPYEPPQSPEIRVDTVSISAEEAADIILVELDERGLTSPST